MNSLYTPEQILQQFTNAWSFYNQQCDEAEPPMIDLLFRECRDEGMWEWDLDNYSFLGDAIARHIMTREQAEGRLHHA